MRHLRTILTLCCGLGGMAVRAADAPSASDLDFFEKKVRPVLVERCYKCHSHDSEKIKGNLLLDSPAAWLKGGDTGPAVVPGQPEKSLLVEAIRYKNGDMEMPPKGKMPDGEIEILVKWVQMGAPAPQVAATTVAAKKGIDLEAGRKFWAYQPIQRPRVPAVQDKAWPKTDVDRFILAKLESHHIHPVADAAPATLVRRVYLDLVGLPPTPEQIDAYLNDKSPKRYEQLVDRLLASPQFGERWGRHWLDVARFGESLTLRGFVIGNAWRYRDYVIDAFNSDRPFDRFMAEQIAGDLMASDTLEEKRRSLAATAFLALGNTNLEEQDKKQLEMDVVDEQIDTMGRAFLAQTIGCARCHDHKFDPIPTKDYYALAGIFHSTTTLEHSNVSKWLDVPLPLDPERERVMKKHDFEVAVVQDKIKAAKAAIAKANPKAKAAVGAASIPIDSLPGIVIDDLQAKRVGSWKASTSVKPYIGTGYLTDDGDRTESKTLTFLFEVTDPGKYEVRFAYTPAPNRATNLPVTVFSADGEKTIIIDEEQPPPGGGPFLSLGSYNFERNGQSFVIISNAGVKGHVVADAVQFLPADAVVAAPTTPDPAATAAAKASPAATELKQLEAELKKLTTVGPQREAVISVREAQDVGNTRINIRGSVHTLGDIAPRGFLQVIRTSHPTAIPEKQSGRLELSRWLIDPENPLPARVLSNRVWQWLTGVGIVRTPDNFGTTGEAPSDPVLLDYLASQLIDEDDWSIKRLIRQVVLSRTYQLSTANDAHAKAVDPENRLYWRMNHRRLDAECIRDSILMSSGRLTLEGGGPSFKTAEVKSDFGYKQTDDTHRSVYLPVFRNSLPEIFEAFDFADPSVSNGRRNVSTVAPQALFMLNHPFVTTQAARAAEKLLADEKLTNDDERITRAYRLTLGRDPSDSERRLAVQFVAGNEKEAWAQLFHALFASMDFRYVD